METLARNACASEAEFSAKVDRLEWVAFCLDEKRQYVKRDDKIEASTPWFTLSKMQRRRLTCGCDTFKPYFAERLYDPAIANKIRALIQAKPVADATVVVQDDGTIVIPVGACSSHHRATFMKQYDGNGRQQVWLHDNGHVMFQDITPQQCAAIETSYHLSMVVCTVHRQPETLVCNGESLEIPYTMGYWRDTSSIPIRLTETGGLRLERVKTSFGISLKEVRLIPSKNESTHNQ